MPVDDLPRVDEHVADIEASADDVWAALIETLDRGFSRPAAKMYARAVGCVDETGFHVVSAVPGSELVLEGRHRFSSYALIFRIEELTAGRSRLRAETRAAFPGATGSLYRMLVIGTRGHVVAVRRLLSGVRQSAESRSRSVA